MDTPEYAELAELHARLAHKLSEMREERNFLRNRVSAMTGEVFSDSPPSSPKRKRRHVDHQLASHHLPHVRKFVFPSQMVLGTVEFSLETYVALKQLFHAMDTMAKGSITQEDFAGDTFQDLIRAMGQWNEMRLYFDEDNSNSIDFGEFLRGFWKWTMQQPMDLAGLSGATFAQVLHEINHRINTKLQELVKLVENQVARSLKARSAPRPTSIVSWRSSGVHWFAVSSAALGELHGLFNVLDDKKVGEITRESFLGAPGRAGVEKKREAWQDVCNHFDTDRSNSIDGKEFVDGFRRWLLNQQVTLSAPRQTFQAVLQLVEAQASSCLVSLAHHFNQNLQQ